MGKTVEVFVYGEEILPDLPEKVTAVTKGEHEVIIWDVLSKDLSGMRRSRKMGVSSFPSVYVDGKRVAGCSSGLWSEEALRRALRA